MGVSACSPNIILGGNSPAIRAGRCDVRLSCIILSATSLPSEKPARQKRAGAFRRTCMAICKMVGWLVMSPTNIW